MTGQGEDRKNKSEIMLGLALATSQNAYVGERELFCDRDKD
jgi:hypothetical protein